MPHRSWNESRASGELPWDTGKPEPLCVEFVTSGAVTTSRTLEIGAGTGERMQFGWPSVALMCSGSMSRRSRSGRPAPGLVPVKLILCSMNSPCCPGWQPERAHGIPFVSALAHSRRSRDAQAASSPSLDSVEGPDGSSFLLAYALRPVSLGAFLLA